MTNNEFQVWLNGFFELEDCACILTGKQLFIIHNHLVLTETVSKTLDVKNAWLKEYLLSLHLKKQLKPIGFYQTVSSELKNWMQSV